jgi:hypothetical protein
MHLVVYCVGKAAVIKDLFYCHLLEACFIDFQYDGWISKGDYGGIIKVLFTS